jgi:inhibitor of cysteine peptidase
MIIVLSFFTLIGCEDLLPGEISLVGTQWRLSAWSDSTLNPLPFTITAEFDESTISGTSAINDYSGSYIATADHIFSVGDLQMTLRGGSEEARQAESTFFELLGQACQFTVNQTTLTLLDAFKNELLIFSKMAPVIGLATVEEIDILIAESHPVQVIVVAKGYLPNPCTEIGPVIQNREGNTFFINIKTRYTQEICIDLLTPFTETISLEVYGLPAGTYPVDVNGVQGSFTLDIDNVPSPDI